MTALCKRCTALLDLNDVAAHTPTCLVAMVVAFARSGGWVLEAEGFGAGPLDTWNLAVSEGLAARLPTVTARDPQGVLVANYHPWVDGRIARAVEALHKHPTEARDIDSCYEELHRMMETSAGDPCAMESELALLCLTGATE